MSERAPQSQETAPKAPAQTQEDLAALSQGVKAKEVAESPEKGALDSFLQALSSNDKVKGFLDEKDPEGKFMSEATKWIEELKGFMQFDEAEKAEWTKTLGILGTVIGLVTSKKEKDEDKEGEESEKKEEETADLTPEEQEALKKDQELAEKNAKSYYDELISTEKETQKTPTLLAMTRFAETESEIYAVRRSKANPDEILVDPLAQSDALIRFMTEKEPKLKDLKITKIESAKKSGGNWLPAVLTVNGIEYQLRESEDGKMVIGKEDNMFKQEFDGSLNGLAVVLESIETAPQV